MCESADGLATDGDGLNHHSGEFLPVTILTAGFLLGAHFVDNHLGPAAVGHHFQLNAGVLHIRLTKGCSLGVLHKENVVEGDRGIDLSLKSVEVVITVGLQPELLARGLDDGVGPSVGSVGSAGAGFGHERKDAVRLGEPIWPEPQSKDKQRSSAFAVPFVKIQLRTPAWWMARPALTIALLLTTKELVDACGQWLPVNRYKPVDLHQVASEKGLLEVLSHQREAVDAVVIEQSLLDERTRESLGREGLLFPAVVVGELMGKVDYHPEEVHLPVDQLEQLGYNVDACLLYTSPSPRDLSTSRMPSSA